MPPSQRSWISGASLREDALRCAASGTLCLCVCESVVTIRSIRAGFDAPAAFAARYQQIFFYNEFGILNAPFRWFRYRAGVTQRQMSGAIIA
jgi:hypothetical protein